MGIEKRRRKRVPKRVTVRYGEHDFSHSGLIDDVSISGAFVVAQYLPPLGARVHLHLIVGPKQFVFLEGEVKRHKIVPPQMRQIEKGGFGVHFLTPAELMAEIAPKLTAMGVAVPGAAPPAPAAAAAASAPGPAAAPPRELRFDVSYAEAGELKRAWDRELRFGGVYVRTDESIARDTPVVVRLTLGFAGGREFIFSAKVMQVLTGSSRGLGLEFQNRTVVERSLLPFMG